MKRPNRLLTLSLISLSLTVFDTGCLKTRAQLKGDSDDSNSGPTPVQTGNVQSVQPQGQYALDEIKNTIIAQEGRLEDLEKAQKDAPTQANFATKDDLKKMEARVVELEQAQVQMLEALKKIQDSPAANPDPLELFDKASDEFKAGNYDGAVGDLDAYLKSPNPSHLQEATYLRAESYFAQKQYKKAIVDYSKFPEKFPKSHYLVTALYKIGLSFDALGMREDARGFYQELVDKFPKSPEAKRVRSKLK